MIGRRNTRTGRKKVGCKRNILNQRRQRWAADVDAKNLRKKPRRKINKFAGEKRRFVIKLKNRSAFFCIELISFRGGQ